MIRIAEIALSVHTAKTLGKYQAAVDGAGSYGKQVEAARAQFSSKNRRGNRAFDEVKSTLDRMCAGARRCMYCEDSAADEVEHHHPKALYPELVFMWSNYLYACGPCNGPKNSSFAVIDRNGAIVDVTRQRNAPVVRPRRGRSALLQPREEDPLECLELDIAGGTFLFVPVGNQATWARADYTIRLLHLNDRDHLPKARREAYESYRARLREYAAERDAGASDIALERMAAALLRAQHPAVWQEMKRQRGEVAELQQLFALVPEALDW